MQAAALAGLLAATFTVREMGKMNAPDRVDPQVRASVQRNIEALGAECARQAAHKQIHLQQSWCGTWPIHAVEQDALGNYTHKVFYRADHPEHPGEE